VKGNEWREREEEAASRAYNWACHAVDNGAALPRQDVRRGSACHVSRSEPVPLPRHRRCRAAMHGATALCVARNVRSKKKKKIKFE